ncbi:MAG: hypothetical protein CBD26_00085 [Candidatus Pelagibacter sp. TMED166]|nr:MAG: hypothetical protein CBD26_00085 [Candidatus Pelagibacter sp. TMED166]|tara:strand:- start:2740 stop:3411 length:672 start_codon:yes stop_codon:yes gene_type:complete
MGFLDNSSITVDAILTKRGREILAAGGDLNINKFALSDEEVDYTLYDVTHPNGTDSYGSVIENMSLLEATPARTTFRSFLVNESQAGSSLNVDTTNYSGVDKDTDIAISPTTVGSPAESYVFQIENSNIVKFSGEGSVKTKTAESVVLRAQSINTAGTTTVTIQGVNSGLVQTVTVNVKPDVSSVVDPRQKQTRPPLVREDRVVNSSSPRDRGGRGGGGYGGR